MYMKYSIVFLSSFKYACYFVFSLKREDWNREPLYIILEQKMRRVVIALNAFGISCYGLRQSLRTRRILPW